MSLPVLNELRNRASKLNAPPKSLLGKAANYIISQWSWLTAWLEDGRLEISNNLAERSIKPFVLGRLNCSDDEFCAANHNFFPTMDRNTLLIRRQLAMPWLNETNTYNNQFRMLYGTDFEQRYIMLAQNYPDRIDPVDFCQHINSSFGWLRNFFAPQEQQQLWNNTPPGTFSGSLDQQRWFYQFTTANVPANSDLPGINRAAYQTFHRIILAATIRRLAYPPETISSSQVIRIRTLS